MAVRGSRCLTLSRWIAVRSSLGPSPHYLYSSKGGGSGGNHPPDKRKQSKNSTIRPIRDAQGMPIWQSASSKKKQKEQNLPRVNGAVLLDPQWYCRQSAGANNSLSGTGAAQRWLRGTRDWIATVRQQVLLNPNTNNSSTDHKTNDVKKKRKNNSSQYHHSAVRLEHTGVPDQLFQDHLDWADGLLARLHQPLAVSWEQQYHNNESDEAEKLQTKDQQMSPHDPDWTVRVHHRSRRSSWAMRHTTSTTTTTNTGGMIHWELYLAVMHRLTTKLSVILDNENDEENSDDTLDRQSDSPPADSDSESDEDSDSDDDFMRAEATPDSTLRPTRCRIEFRRDLLYPQEPLPVLTPIVEWHTSGSGSGGGHVTIHLQGTATAAVEAPPMDGRRRRKRPARPLTLSYTASFATF